MLGAFEAYNRGKSYDQQIKPFNFLLSAHVAAFGHPEGVDPERFHLIGPYTADPRQWRKLTWIDLYSAKRYRISTTAQTGGVEVVRVRTYSEVIDEYRTHPESKFIAPNGQPCRRQTRGLLRRRPAQARSITYIGKEANKLEDVQDGMVHDLGQVLATVTDPKHDPWRTRLLPILREIPRAELARRTGVSERSVTRWRNGHAMPRPEEQARLSSVAAGADADAPGSRVAAGAGPCRQSRHRIGRWDKVLGTRTDPPQERDRGILRPSLGGWVTGRWQQGGVNCGCGAIGLGEVARSAR